MSTPPDGEEEGWTSITVMPRSKAQEEERKRAESNRGKARKPEAVKAVSGRAAAAKPSPAPRPPLAQPPPPPPAPAAVPGPLPPGPPTGNEDVPVPLNASVVVPQGSAAQPTQPKRSYAAAAAAPASPPAKAAEAGPQPRAAGAAPIAGGAAVPEAARISRSPVAPPPRAAPAVPRAVSQPASKAAAVAGAPAAPASRIAVPVTPVKRKAGDDEEADAGSRPPTGRGRHDDGDDDEAEEDERMAAPAANPPGSKKGSRRLKRTFLDSDDEDGAAATPGDGQGEAATSTPAAGDSGGQAAVAAATTRGGGGGQGGGKAKKKAAKVAAEKGNTDVLLMTEEEREAAEADAAAAAAAEAASATPKPSRAPAAAQRLPPLEEDHQWACTLCTHRKKAFKDKAALAHHVVSAHVTRGGDVLSADEIRQAAEAMGLATWSCGAPRLPGAKDHRCISEVSGGCGKQASEAQGGQRCKVPECECSSATQGTLAATNRLRNLHCPVPACEYHHNHEPVFRNPQALAEHAMKDHSMLQRQSVPGGWSNFQIHACTQCGHLAEKGDPTTTSHICSVANPNNLRDWLVSGAPVKEFALATGMAEKPALAFDHPTPCQAWVQQNRRIGAMLVPMMAAILLQTTAGDLEARRHWLLFQNVFLRLLCHDVSPSRTAAAEDTVKHRLNTIKSNSIQGWMDLWHAWRKTPVKRQPAGQEEADDNELAEALRWQRKANFVRTLVGCGELSKAGRVVLQEGNVVEVTEEKLEAIRNLFPPAPPHVDRWKEPAPPAATASATGEQEAEEAGEEEAEEQSASPLEVADVERTLRKALKRGRAAGIDGVRAELVLALLDTAAGAQAVTAYVNCMLAGDVDADVMAFLVGGLVVPIDKPPKDPGGVHGVRPIVLQAVMYKAAATVAAAKVGSVVAEICGPMQMGLRKGGAELAVHLIRLCTEQPETVVLQADFENAYGNTKRAAFLGEMWRHKALRGAYPLVKAAYGGCDQQLCVVMEDGTVEWVTMATGVAQGDPLSPYLFSLAMHLAYKRAHARGLEEYEKHCAANSVAAEASRALAVFFLDDGTFAGDAVYVAAAGQALEEEAATVGCKLNRSKTNVMGKTGDQKAGAAAKRIAAALKVRVAEGLEILGAGFGAAQASKVLDKYVVEVQALATAVLKLEDAQTAHKLLVYCGVTKLGYAAATHFPQDSKPRAEAVDKVLEKTLDKLLLPAGQSLSRPAHMQAKLAISQGGLGLTSCAKQVQVRWLGGVERAAREIVAAPERFGGLQSWLQNTAGQYGAVTKQALADVAKIVPASETDKLPSSVDQLLSMSILGRKTLAQQVQAGELERARIAMKGEARKRNHASASDTFASAAFVALPCAPNIMAHQQYQQACLIRLGEVDKWPTNDAAPAFCRCGKAKPDVAHLLTCVKAGNLTRRHNTVAAGIEEVLRESGKTAIREPSLESVPGGRSNQYADIVTYNVLADGSKPEILDIRISSTFGKAIKGVGAGEAARLGHVAKLKSYEEVTKAGGGLVVPQVWDTTGAPAPQGEVMNFIKRLGKSLYVPRPGSISWLAPTPTVALVQRLSVVVHSAVANSVLLARSLVEPGLHARSGQVVAHSHQMHTAAANAQQRLAPGGRLSWGAQQPSAGGAGRGGRGGRGAGRGQGGRAGAAVAGGRGRGGAPAAAAAAAAVGGASL